MGTEERSTADAAFEKWFAEEKWETDVSGKEILREAFMAGRYSVLGDLNPEDER